MRLLLFWLPPPYKNWNSSFPFFPSFFPMNFTITVCISKDFRIWIYFLLKLHITLRWFAILMVLNLPTRNLSPQCYLISEIENTKFFNEFCKIWPDLIHFVTSHDLMWSETLHILFTMDVETFSYRNTTELKEMVMLQIQRGTSYYIVHLFEVFIDAP